MDTAAYQKGVQDGSRSSIEAMQVCIALLDQHQQVVALRVKDGRDWPGEMVGVIVDMLWGFTRLNKTYKRPEDAEAVTSVIRRAQQLIKEWSYEA